MATRLRDSTRAATSSAARRGIRFVIPGDREWPRQVDDLEAARASTSAVVHRSASG